MHKNLDDEVYSNRVYTTGDVAKILGVCNRTVVNIFDKDELKGYHVPGSKDRRIPYKNLVEFIEENKIPENLINNYHESMNKERNGNDSKENKVYTTTEVAKICKVSTRTVHKWFDKFGLKGYIVGKADRRIPHDNLIELINNNL